MTCREVHEALAAYADQQLPAGERDAIAAHLCGCAWCRRDLADLIDVRTLLGACAQANPPLPADLSGRLVAIAGQDADQELWLSASGANRLPSLRRRRRNRTLFVVTALTASALGAMGSVALMAPGLPRIDDPDGTPSGGVPMALRSSGSGHASAVSCPQGYDCPEELAGLELAAAEVEGANSRIELTYGSDGEVVVVLQQRGQLSGSADAGVAARTWQSGETVYCVMADDKGLAEQAAEALPHAGAVGLSTRERLTEGWHQLVGHRG